MNDERQQTKIRPLRMKAQTLKSCAEMATELSVCPYSDAGRLEVECSPYWYTTVVTRET